MSLPLTYHPALEQPDLLAPPVAAALRSLPWADQVRVAAIDPALADTAQFCETYGVTLEESANCVVIAAKRGSRGDLRGLHGHRHHPSRRQRAGAASPGSAKASFGPMDAVTSLSGMEYGGITPIGLPESWPVLVDDLVAKSPTVVSAPASAGPSSGCPVTCWPSFPPRRSCPASASSDRPQRTTANYVVSAGWRDQTAGIAL